MRSGRGRGRRIIPRNNSDAKTFDSGFDTCEVQSGSQSSDQRVPLGINPQPSNFSNIQNNSRNDGTTPGTTPNGINRMEYEHKMPKCGDQVCLKIFDKISNFFLFEFRELNLMLNDGYPT